MANKGKTIRDEFKLAAKRLQEIQQLKEQQETEEKETLANVEAHINELCNENELFCGMILTTPDLLAIIQLAIESKEQITIPFRLYLKDN